MKYFSATASGSPPDSDETFFEDVGSGLGAEAVGPKNEAKVFVAFDAEEATAGAVEDENVVEGDGDEPNEELDGGG